MTRGSTLRAAPRPLSRTAYAAYGLRLDSAIAFEGMPPARGNEPGRLELDLARSPSPDRVRPASPAEVEFPAEGRTVSLHVQGGLEIRCEGLFAFHLPTGSTRIRCEAGPDGTLDRIRHWFLHYVLPMHLLVERRVELLHGGAVRIGDGAVGFLGPSGAGKSTLVDHLLRRGHALLTDDKLGIVRGQGRILAVPGIPYYCADPGKVRRTCAANFAAHPLPLRALYLIEPAPPDGSVAIVPVPATAAAFALARRCELQVPPPVREALGLPSPVARNFALCADLAAALPVRRLAVPRILSRLPEVARAVAADLASVA